MADLSGKYGNSPVNAGMGYFDKYLLPSAETPDYTPTADDVNARQKFDEAQTYQTDLSNQAKTYRQNLGGTQNALMNQASDTGKRGLAQNIASTKAAASSRGLLNSGIQQGAQSKNYGNYLSGLSNARSGINQQTTSNADQMQSQAIASGTDLQQQRQAMEDAIYARQNQQYQNYTTKQQQDRGILGGLGGAIGKLL